MSVCIMAVGKGLNVTDKSRSVVRVEGQTKFKACRHSVYIYGVCFYLWINDFCGICFHLFMGCFTIFISVLFYMFFNIFLILCDECMIWLLLTVKYLPWLIC